MSGGTLYQQVVEEMAELARTGAPDPTNWTCGRCGLDGKGGVRSYVTEVELRPARGRKPRLVDFVAHLVCPCCTFAGCPHRTEAMEVAQ